MSSVRTLPLFLVLACAPSTLACLAAPPRSAQPMESPPGSDAPVLDGRPPRPLVEDGAFYVLGEDPVHPRVRTLEGQLSLNDSCMIRLGNKLSRRVPPMYVNGQPLGFC